MGLKQLVAKAFNLQGNSHPNGVGRSASDSWTPPASYAWNWWQQDKPMLGNGFENNTTVEACVVTISQSIAQLPIKHMRDDGKGGKEEIKNSAVTRVMRKPNPYQTKSEFFVDLVRKMLLTGNGYGVATRNGRFEIDAIYPQLRMSPYVSYDAKDVYYSGADNTLIELDQMIPSRNVLHVKMHTNQHPLIGCTPLEAVMMSAATGNSIQGHTNAFFNNMSRPSGVLSTDMTLTPEQTKALRERFSEVTEDLATGGTPILTSGLKYQSISMSAVDAEIIKTYQMTIGDIARVYRVPLELIGASDKPTAGSTENLMRFFVTSGLGFIIEHLENSLERLFDLPAGESIELDPAILLEATMKDKFESLKIATTGGIMSPNEARNKVGLSDVTDGDVPLVQMQMVELGVGSKMLEAEESTTPNETEPNAQTPEAEEIDTDTTKMILKGLI